MDADRAAHDRMPPLGHLRTPRKTNRKAVRRVLEGDLLWDKRAVARAERKKALQRQQAQADHPRPHTLTKQQRQWLLGHLTGWTWDQMARAFTAPERFGIVELDELVEALHLPYAKRAVISIQGLDLEVLQGLAQLVPDTVVIQQVEVSHDGLARMRRVRTAAPHLPA